MFTYPNYLLPIDAFQTVEVVREVREKTDENGNQKRAAWNGLPGWVVPVEVIRGEREKALPNGKTVTVLDSDVINVTVWNERRPGVAVGDYVTFDGLAFGAVDSSLFVQALDCSSADTLALFLEGGKDDE